MKDLQRVKAIGEQLLALSVELLRLFDMDEQERIALIERAKKTASVRLFPFRTVRRTKKATKNVQAFILLKRR